MQMLAQETHVVSGIQAGVVLHFLNQIEGRSDEIIAQLPGMDDEAVLEVRLQAKALGRAAWRIEIAADAEILKRENQRRGRGVKDVEGKGVTAAVRKHAAEIGVNPRTIFQNAAIHQTFFNSASANTNNAKEGVKSVLEEKEYYRAAHQTEDPHATLEIFARKKSEDPFFTTREAWRYVRELKAPPIDSPVPPLIEDTNVSAWFGDFQAVVGRAPDVGLKRILRDAIDEVRYHVQKPGTTRLIQLLELIENKVDEQDLIATEINVDRVHVAVWLNRMEEDGLLTRFEKERAPGARGAARTGYLLTTIGKVRLLSKK